MDDGPVQALMSQLAQSVRAVDVNHVVFAEPSIADATPHFPPLTASAIANTIPPGMGYTSHLYCLGAVKRRRAGACPGGEKATLGAIAHAISARNAPYFLGEFGSSDQLAEQIAIIDSADQRFLPWADYAYNEIADDPGSPQGGLLINQNLLGSEANAKQAKLNALVVPYPMAVAGTPLHWTYDRGTGHVSFTYSTQNVDGGRLGPSATTVIFIPRRHYPHGYRAIVRGARVVSPRRWPWLMLRALPRARSVTVTIVRTSRGQTLTPLEVNECGYDLAPCGS
jgi:endoglycosylceramidase